MRFASTLVALVLFAAPLGAQTCPNNDSFEPNDDCASATPLGAGLTAGLAVVEDAVPSEPGDLDLYRITIPPGEALSARTRYDPSLNLQPRLLDAACTEVLDTACCSGDDEVTYRNPGATPLEVVLSIGHPGGTGASPPCVDYEVEVTLGFDPCLSIPDDGFEPNDECAAATAVAPGVLSGLQATEDAFDHYRIDVPPDHRLTVRTFRASAPHRFTIRLSDGAGTCGPQVLSSGATNGDEGGWTNLDDVTQEVTVLVSPIDDCVLYDLEFTVDVDPCTTAADDAFEPNDDRAEAVPLPPGRYDDLFVIRRDSDFYVVDVESGATLTVILLEAPLGAAPTYVFLTDEANFPLFTQDASGPGYRQFRWFNSRTSTVPVNVAVSAPFVSQFPVCTRYDLVLSIEAGEAGSAYCAGDVNGSGAAAEVASLGSSSTAANDLVLRASPIPTGTFGLFFHGPSAANGDLSGRPRCVGGPFHRSAVVGAGGGDTLEWTLDNTTQPAVLVGATRYFQTWFRDPGANPSHNTSGGYRVTFTH